MSCYYRKNKAKGKAVSEAGLDMPESDIIRGGVCGMRDMRCPTRVHPFPPSGTCLWLA